MAWKILIELIPSFAVWEGFFEYQIGSQKNIDGKIVQCSQGSQINFERINRHPPF